MNTEKAATSMTQLQKEIYMFLKKLAAMIGYGREKRTHLANSVYKEDHANLHNQSDDPGPDVVIAACAQWLCEAQDHSASFDGGVARDYSLQKGWATSYPETTGYIIPTMIELADHMNQSEYLDRARRMLDWCVDIQFPEGGFQGGKIDSQPKVPVIFNTGQILLGLSAGARKFGDSRYLEAMHNAASWLRDVQDEDGCWRKYPTPFANPGEKAYETHVAWGLFEADRIAPGFGYGEAGLKQVAWALSKQHANGWFESNCLYSSDNPLTHTIGYVLRGLIEAHRFSGEPEHLNAAVLTAQSIVPLISNDGRLAGRFDSNWEATVDYVCLTGSVQIAHCFFLLADLTQISIYADYARKLNAYVRRTVRLHHAQGVRGGIKGSYPIDGGYGRWEYLNWAAKFCIDSQLFESKMTAISVQGTVH